MVSDWRTIFCMCGFSQISRFLRGLFCWLAATEGQPPDNLPPPPIPPEKPADEGPETTSRRETVNMDHPVILGSVLGFMLLLLVVFIVMCLWKQRQQKRRSEFLPEDGLVQIIRQPHSHPTMHFFPFKIE